jgi:hypothetical protein
VFGEIGIQKWMAASRIVSCGLSDSCSTQCSSSGLDAKSVKPVPVYESKAFARFQRKAGIADSDLWDAAQVVNGGMLDVDLGGGVIKQRIAKPGHRKSGGARLVVLSRQGSRRCRYTGLRKKAGPISGLMDWKRFAHWPGSPWDTAQRK